MAAVAVDPKIDGATVLLRAATEVSAVFFQVACFSRLGATARGSDEPSLAANLVLFVTLVVFQFPYLNGYIVLMYDTCVMARTSALRVFLCVVLIGCQLLGVWLATLLILCVQNEALPWNGTITWMAPKKAATPSDAGRNLGVEFFEEFVAVTALLVGYVHLTYLNFEYAKEPAKRLFQSSAHLFSKIEPAIHQLPIPLPFILQVTLLVAGLLRAFPSAHLSPHVSLYVALMGYSTWGAFGFRILGGAVALLVTYVLFWVFYVRRTGVHKVPTLKGLFAGRILEDVPASVNPAADYERLYQRAGTAISFHNAYRHVYRAP